MEEKNHLFGFEIETNHNKFLASFITTVAIMLVITYYCFFKFAEVQYLLIPFASLATTKYKIMKDLYYLRNIPDKLFHFGSFLILVFMCSFYYFMFALILDPSYNRTVLATLYIIVIMLSYFWNIFIKPIKYDGGEVVKKSIQDISIEKKKDEYEFSDNDKRLIFLAATLLFGFLFMICSFLYVVL